MLTSLLLLCGLLHNLPLTTPTPTAITTYSSIQISNHHHNNHNNNDHSNHRSTKEILTTPASSPSPPSILIIDRLRDQLTLAGELLSHQTQRLTKPVQCHCQDFCGGRCFAPGCHTCTANIFDGDEFLCLASGPFGGGLLCQHNNDDDDSEVACCQPDDEEDEGDSSSRSEPTTATTTTACRIIEGRDCDCTKFPPMLPLFPPPPNRRYVKDNCISSNTSATMTESMEFVVDDGVGGDSTSTTDTSTTSPSLPIRSYYGTIGIVVVVVVGMMMMMSLKL